MGTRTFTLTLAVFASAGCGSREWRDADSRLTASAADARREGYAPLPGPYNDFGSFADSGTAEWTVSLEAGRRYFVAAACSGACSQLDFVIAAPGLEPVADTGTGATARLAFLPVETGEHRVTVRHGACDADRCRWVAQVYARPRD